jgi:hypothetical protein
MFPLSINKLTTKSPRFFCCILFILILISFIPIQFLYHHHFPTIIIPKTIVLAAHHHDNQIKMKSSNRKEPIILTKLKERAANRNNQMDSNIAIAMQGKRVKRTFVCAARGRTQDMIITATKQQGANCLATGLYFYPLAAVPNNHNNHNNLPSSSTSRTGSNPSCLAPWFFSDYEMYQGQETDCDSIPCRPWQAESYLRNLQTNVTGVILLVIHTSWSRLDSPESQQYCGLLLKKLLAKELFGRGYKGEVLITTPDFHGDPFLKVSSEDVNHEYAAKTFIGYSKASEIEINAVRRIRSISSRVGVFGPDVIYSIATGALYEDARVVSVNGVMEILDSPDEVIRATQLGADLVFTRKPNVVVKALRSIDRSVPKIPGQDLPPMTPAYLLASQRSAGGFHPDECKCTYFYDDRDDKDGGRVDGCAIVVAPPPGRACYCERVRSHNSLLNVCKGRVILCPKLKSVYCHEPDTAISTCEFGGGDCLGYNYWAGHGNCACSYRRGGCVISKPAPAHGACKCVLKGPLMCDGIVTFCKNPASDQCIKPDTSLSACLGGGAYSNCNGYVV